MKHSSTLLLLVSFVIFGVFACSTETEVLEGSIGVPVVTDNMIFTVINVDERIYGDYSEGDFRSIAIPFRFINQSEKSITLRPEDFQLTDGAGANQPILNMLYLDSPAGAREIEPGHRLHGNLLTGSTQPIEELKLEYSSDFIPKGFAARLVRDEAARQLAFTSDDLAALVFEEGDYRNSVIKGDPIIFEDTLRPRALISIQHLEDPTIQFYQPISERDDSSHLTVWIYGYASRHSVESAFYNLTPYISPLVDDIGEIAKFHSQEGESEIHSTRLTFTRCHVFVEIGGSNDENGATYDEVVQYAKKLDKRLKRVVC